jgi:tRNA A37 threonylcarbamoyladenosine synthetase subunit TsaC/SUA5/YrdC
MRKQLSQQKLLEILCHEIDMLQETSKNINEIAPAIARQLHELKTTKLKYDLNTERLEWLLAKHEKTLAKSMVIPKWLLIAITALILLYSLSISALIIN